MIRQANGKYWLDDVEISAEEYNALHEAIMEKRSWVRRVYLGESQIDDVPEEWRSEVIEAVDVIRREEQREDDIDEAEAYAIIFGGAE